MLALIQNELIKIFRRTGTLVMIGLLLLIVIGTGVLTKYTMNSTVSSSDWKQELQQKNSTLSIEAANVPADSPMSKFYEEEIAINTYQIEHDMKPDSTVNAWSFVQSATGILSFVALFTIIIAASIVSLEFSWGTIKLIMIRSASRVEVLLAKYITVILFSLLLISLLFISSFLLGLGLFGIDGNNVHLTYHEGSVMEENIMWYLMKYFLLSSVSLWVVGTMAFMISTVFRNNSLALGISLFAYFSGEIVTQLIATKYEWAKYILFANTDLTMYTSGSVLVKGMTPTFSVAVLAVYMIIFLLISFVSFTKRDIAS